MKKKDYLLSVNLTALSIAVGKVRNMLLQYVLVFNAVSKHKNFKKYVFLVYIVYHFMIYVTLAELTFEHIMWSIFFKNFMLIQSNTHLKIQTLIKITLSHKVPDV